MTWLLVRIFWRHIVVELLWALWRESMLLHLVLLELRLMILIIKKILIHTHWTPKARTTTNLILIRVFFLLNPCLNLKLFGSFSRLVDVRFMKRSVEGRSELLWLLRDKSFWEVGRWVITMTFLERWFLDIVVIFFAIVGVTWDILWHKVWLWAVHGSRLFDRTILKLYLLL